jgi:hypothetical protein
MTARLSIDAPLASATSWPARKPNGFRFHETYCASCGGVFGAGNQGFSHCDQHSSPETLAAHLAMQPGSAVKQARAAIESQAKESAAWLASQHRDGVIPPAEKIVLDCLRALQAIPQGERLYADELTDVIAKGFLATAQTPVGSRRRIAALLRIGAEAA